MINRQEIMDFSREFGLTPNIVEKDYALGWMLAGIYANPKLSSDWIFKGGTCLKKCWFETYRFSEDLDFTVKSNDYLKEDVLIDLFKEVTGWVYDNTGIEIPQNTIKFEVYKNPRNNLSIQGRVGYKGPLQPGGDLPRVKIDITNDEVMVLKTVNRQVHHPYTDAPASGISVQSYCYEELFAEKVRALAERLRPRDLYDVVHLYRHETIKQDRTLIFDTLKKKCEFKAIPVPDFQSLENNPWKNEIQTEWENMLAHQLPVLPQFEDFWRELPSIFSWLHQARERQVLPSMPISMGNIDARWQMPAMAQSWGMRIPIETIRFAAANRLCVALDYVDEKGSRKKRVIEPYSLRRTKDGNLLLYILKHDTGEIRSYRLDRIQHAEVTNITFNPKYVIELTTGGISFNPGLRKI